jgi:hypothetical protein
MGKGGHWSPELSARRDYLASRRWLASFADESETLVYAWTHPGAFVVSEPLLGHDRYSVFQTQSRADA